LSTEPGKRKDAYEQWVEDGEAEQMLALIQSAAMQGLSVREIAIDVGVSENTLNNLRKKHFEVSAVLKKGRKAVVAQTQSALMRLVKEGNPTAVIYALKVYGGPFFNDRIPPPPEQEENNLLDVEQESLRAISREV